MRFKCPYCQVSPNPSTARPRVVRLGFYKRKSDSHLIQRYKCRQCTKSFSTATYLHCYRQNKRNQNESLRLLLVSGVSQRRAARVLRISRTTVVRKFRYLAQMSRLKMSASRATRSPISEFIFDDLETFEHTKCKPLSVTLAVDHKRRILGFRVAQMPANGRLAAISRKKYGRRADHRKRKRRELFRELLPYVVKTVAVTSDQNPHYLPDVREFFPSASYTTFKGARPAATGQGELKKIRFDPLFKINHSNAMLRANINRLFRKTWCTTKLSERLSDHIAIYAQFHNEELRKKSKSLQARD